MHVSYTTGACNEIKYRKYDYNYHQGMLEGEVDYPVYEGNAGEWTEANGSRVRYSGQWRAQPRNGAIICVLKVGNDEEIDNTDTDWGVLVLHFQIDLVVKRGTQINRSNQRNNQNHTP